MSRTPEDAADCGMFRLSFLDNLGRVPLKSMIHATRFRRRFFFSGALKDPAGACRTCAIAQIRNYCRDDEAESIYALDAASTGNAK